MSAEQPEALAVETHAPQPFNGPLTSPAPTTQRQKKNPKRVAVGKLVAERNRLTREAQKKAVGESNDTIADNKAKKAASEEKADPKDTSRISFGTVLALDSLLVGVAALYYQLEAMQESKSLAPKSKESAPNPPVPSEPAPAPQRKGGIRKMD